MLDEWAVEYGNGFGRFWEFICKELPRGTCRGRAVAHAPRTGVRRRPAAVRAGVTRTRFEQVLYKCYMTYDWGLVDVYTSRGLWGRNASDTQKGDRREHGAA